MTTVPQVPTSTPVGTREWELQGISVEGNTITVSLGVFAGIDVDATAGGTPPNRVDASIPILEFVFEDVAAGEHPVVISDVVGFSERASVIVEAPDSGPNAGNYVLPDWLAEWVADLDAGKIEFPPWPSSDPRTRGELSTT